MGLSEQELREALHKFSHDSRLLDPKVKTYLPAVGGLTIYTFGDARKLKDQKAEVCVRVHNEWIGSDVFGSDICSCRPYLIFALREAVECAQRDGVDVVIYFRKEGRSLGESDQVQSVQCPCESRWRRSPGDVLPPHRSHSRHPRLALPDHDAKCSELDGKFDASTFSAR